MFRTDLLSIMSSLNTVYYTAIDICLASYVDYMLMHLVAFYYKNISQCTVL